MHHDKHKNVFALTPASLSFSRSNSVGYDRVLFSRPDFSALLLKKIPPKNLRMSKKVLTFEQDQDGVTVTFEDNTTARGDILVGADGAHSAVRQHLYKTLGKQHVIPKVDNKPLSKGYISLVGTTGALDPVKYPCVLKEESDVHYVIGDNDTPYSVSFIQVSKYF